MSGSVGDELDGDVGETPDPAVQPVIDLAHDGVAQSALPHGLLDYGVIAWVIVENNGYDPGLRCAGGVIGTNDGHCGVRALDHRSDRRAQWLADGMAGSKTDHGRPTGLLGKNVARAPVPNRLIDAHRRLPILDRRSRTAHRVHRLTSVVVVADDCHESHWHAAVAGFDRGPRCRCPRSHGPVDADDDGSTVVVHDDLPSSRFTS